jgi:hypothetical protein
MNKVFILIEPGFQEYKESILTSLCTASDQNLVIVTGLNKTVPAEWARKYAKDWIEIEYDDPRSFEKVISYCRDKNYQIVGAATYIQTSIDWTNVFQHKCGLPVISRIQDQTLRNKITIRRICDSVPGVNPKWAPVQSFDSFQSESLMFQFPLIIKPADLMSSLAVSKVNSLEELKPAIQQALTADFVGENLRESYGDISTAAIAEEFVDGQEYSVEALVSNGTTQIIGITKKSISNDGHFAETEHQFPAPDLNEMRTKKIHQTIKSIHQALELENTLTHTEIKVSDQGIKLIEINCRAAGDLITKIIELSCSIDFGKLIYAIHTKSVLPILPIGPSDLTPYTIGFFINESQAIVRHIPYLNSDKQGGQVFVTPGYRIQYDPFQGWPRLGYWTDQTRNFPTSFRAISSEFKFEESDEIPSPDNHLLFRKATPEDIDLLDEIETFCWDHKQRASRDTILARLRSQNSMYFIALNRRSLKPISSVLFVGTNPWNRSNKWLDFAKQATSDSRELTSETKYLYILSVNGTPNAPKNTTSNLIKSAVAFLTQMSPIKQINCGVRLTGLSAALKNGTSIYDYIDRVISGSEYEPAYGALRNAKFAGVEPIENYYDDPLSANFGYLMRLEIEK